MCGGIPFSTASVVKILRKSWGVKLRTLPLASVSPVAARAALSSWRIPLPPMGLFSMPMRRWKIRGGDQTRSWES